MLVLETIVLATTDNGGGMRGILFVLVLVAVILLIAGATIALMTFFNLRKEQALQLEAQNI